MTDQEIMDILPNLSMEELKTLDSVNPDILAGADQQILNQVAFNDAIAQAIEAGADDAEIEAMTTAFETGGIDAVTGAVDLPITIMGAGATALAWLDGTPETKQTIAKDAGKTQNFIDQEVDLAIVETAEAFKESAEVIEDVGQATGEFVEDTAKDIGKFFKGIF